MVKTPKHKSILRNWLLVLLLVPLVSKGQDQLKITEHETLKGHSGAVYSVAFSSEGPYVASGSDDNTIKLWNPEAGKLIQTLEGHSESVNSVAFSPYGQYLASGSRDNTIKLWHPESGKLLRTLEGHSDWVYSVAFSPDGEYLASGGADETIKLWNPESGKLIRTLKGHPSSIRSVTFSPDGEYLASGSADETIKLWNPESGKLIRTLEGHSSWVTSVAFSPGREYLASGSEDEAIKLWNPESGKLIRTLKGHSSSVRSIAFSSDREYLASGSWDETIKLWNPESGKLIRTLKGHSSSVRSIAFCLDGEYIASGSYDEIIKLWQIQNLYYSKIKAFVKNRPEQWREQGAYAKLAAYRSNPDSMGQVITQQAKNKFGKKAFKEVKPDGTFNYDTRNQTFKLDFPRLYPIYVEVPLKEAKAFNKHFQKLEYQNLQFDYDTAQGRFYLKEAAIYNPANDKQYHYNIEQEVNYQEQTIQKPKTAGLSVNMGQPEQEPKDDKKETSKGPDPTDLDPQVTISKNLPNVSANHQKDFAVVIGNSQYQETKNVHFADRDAKLMKRYLVEVLGFKQGNVFHLTNATQSDFRKLFGTKGNPKGKLYNTIKQHQSDVFIYYSGHGAPSQETKQGYFVPTDADPAYLTFQGYSLSTFYDNLSELPAQTKTVVLDACFSGADLLESVSSVRIEVKEKYKQKKDMAVLTSSTGTQYSTWYDAKQHGLLTWFFLKAIKVYRQVDTNDDRQVTLKEIHQYISDNNQGVPYYARRLHGKKQEPKLMGGEQDEVLFKY